ncbi:hypothetical protein ACIQXU_12785 [Peribacillus sp. NPDC097284]|uniref:hypothetical protein n=1 Tax=Peribacillus sp. NPDC097284 TaxID=3364401 RepID=UPI00382FC71D
MAVILGVTVLLFLLFLFNYPKIDRSHKREKTVVLLLAIGWVLAILLILFPEMPGPTQIFNILFGPLKKLL